MSILASEMKTTTDLGFSSLFLRYSFAFILLITIEKYRMSKVPETFNMFVDVQKSLSAGYTGVGIKTMHDSGVFQRAVPNLGY